MMGSLRRLAAMVALDGLALTLAWVVGRFLLGAGWRWGECPVAVGLSLAGMALLGHVYRQSGPFVDRHEVIAVARGMLAAALAWGALSGGAMVSRLREALAMFVVGVPLVLLWRAMRSWRMWRGQRPPATLRRTVVFGAGEAGRMVVREAEKYPELGLTFLGFLDDDRNKKGLRVAGLKVLGGLELLPELVTKHRCDLMIIAMPSASGKAVRRVVEACEPFKDLEIRIVPGTRQIIAGEVRWDQIREVKVEDLLGREVVRLDNPEIAGLVEGKTVLVTGAGGSIGSELVRQVLARRPGRLLLLGRGENSVFEVEQEVRPQAERLGVTVEPVIMDVRDTEAVRRLFERDRIPVVFHAAAHKHVPLMEVHPAEAFLNNAVGTLNILEAAGRTGSERVVLISTDKAVHPTSVMGASKRLAELLMSACAERWPATRYAAVRFGNVLGSRGSVVPLFKRQIRRGGPVTVTHPDVTRYFMTIPEAVALVLQAATLAERGEIFVLDMGEPVRIRDLAAQMIRLCGLVPGEDIEIVYTGLRPGEKLHEELLTGEEGVTATKLDRILVAPRGVVDPAIPDRVRELAPQVAAMPPERVRTLIFELIGA